MIGRNMSNIEAAGDFRRPGPGGYIVRIEQVYNDTAKERLELKLEIAEGEFAGFIKETSDRFGFWSARATKSYKTNALPFFRAFIEAVQESNGNPAGLVIGDYEDIDENKLPGLIVGVAVGERLYTGNDGAEKKALDWFNANFVPVEKIRSGDFEVPALRDTRESAGVKATDPAAVKVTDGGFEELKDQDVPF